MPVRARRPSVMYSAFAGIVKRIACDPSALAPLPFMPFAAAPMRVALSLGTWKVNLGDSAETHRRRACDPAVASWVRLPAPARSLTGRRALAERDGHAAALSAVHDRER